MSLLTFKFSQATKLFEIWVWYCFLNSSSLSFLRLKLSLHIKLLCCLFTYCQSFPKFCNNQIVTSITVSSPERSHIEFTQMPSLIYQYVMNMVVSSHQEKSKCIYDCFGAATSCSQQLGFWCGKFYSFNTIIIIILM